MSENKTLSYSSSSNLGSVYIDSLLDSFESVRFSNEEKGYTIAPALVHRISLHPCLGKGNKIEERNYYTLHNDRGEWVYTSPFIEIEEDTNISKTIIHKKNKKPINGWYISPAVLPSNSTGNNGNNENDNYFGETNFDDYAADIVRAKTSGSPTRFKLPNKKIASTFDITDFYQDRQKMQTARYAMMNTRNKSTNSGLEINHNYTNLRDATGMYSGSLIEDFKANVPELMDGRLMFQNCPNLKKAELNDCNNLLHADYMFHCCSSLVEVSMDDTDKLKTAKYMFSESPLLKWVSLDVSALEDMESMFEKTTDVHINPEAMGTNSNQYNKKFPKVQDASRAFAESKIVEAVGFNMPSILNANEMFADCVELVRTKSCSFGTSSGENTSLFTADKMFKGCTKLEEDFTNFNAAKSVTDIFKDCNNLKKVGNSFASLQSAENLFADKPELLYATHPVDAFKNTTSVSSMYKNDEKLLKVYGVVDSPQYHQIESTIDNTFSLTFYKNVNVDNLFANCFNLELVDLLFNEGCSNIDTMFSGVTRLKEVKLTINKQSESLHDLFSGQRNLTKVKISFPDNTIFDRMFKGCTRLKSLEVGDMSAAVSAVNMCYGCSSLSGEINLGNATKLTNMDGMFANSAISSIKGGVGLRDNSKNTISPFTACTNLKTAELSMPYLDDGSNLFRNLPSLTSVYSNGYPNLTIGKYMFRDCPNIKEVVWTPALSNGLGMYQRSGVTNIPSSLADWPITNAKQMFYQANIQTEHVDINLPYATDASFFLNGTTNVKSISINLPNANGDYSVNSLIGNNPNITTVTSAVFGPNTKGQISDVSKLDESSINIILEAVRNAGGEAYIEVGVDSAVKSTAWMDRWGAEDVKVIDANGKSVIRTVVYFNESHSNGVKIFWT